MIQDDYPGIQIAAERGVRGPDFAGEADAIVTTMLQQHPELRGIWAIWDVPAQGVVTAIRRAGRNNVIVATQDLGKNIAIELAQGGIVKSLAAQQPYDHGVTEAILAGYALLDQPAPTDVVYDGIAVTRENVLDAWQAIYHHNAPPEVQAALKS